MVRLEKVVNLDGGEEPPPPPPPPPPSSISFVGQATRNTNSTAVHGARCPTTVQAGDVLLLFASQGSDRVLTGPGAGWIQVGRVVDSSHGHDRVAQDRGRRRRRPTVRLTSGGPTPRWPSRWPPTAASTPATRGLDHRRRRARQHRLAHDTGWCRTRSRSLAGVVLVRQEQRARPAWTAPAGETSARHHHRLGKRPRRHPAHRPPGRADGRNAGDHRRARTRRPTRRPAPRRCGRSCCDPPADTPPSNQPPIAPFTRNCTGSPCTFDAIGSTDPEDSIDSVRWDFGDGDDEHRADRRPHLRERRAPTR